MPYLYVNSHHGNYYFDSIVSFLKINHILSLCFTILLKHKKELILLVKNIYLIKWQNKVQHTVYNGVIPYTMLFYYEGRLI